VLSPVAFAQERSRGDFPAAGGDQHGINHRFIIMVSVILVLVGYCMLLYLSYHHILVIIMIIIIITIILYLSYFSCCNIFYGVDVGDLSNKR